MGTVNEKMTALADEIRELSGTTTPKSIDTMTSDVDAANAEIAEQTELLEQIATALEGKAAGGSGGGNMVSITINNFASNAPIWYWDSDKSIRQSISSETISAWCGITFVSMYIPCYPSGDYVSSSVGGYNSFVFSSNGTLTLESGEAG